MDKIADKVKEKALAPQREANQYLLTIATQNEELSMKMDALIGIESEKVEELKAMNARQAKENKYNFPFILSSALFGYSGLHIMLYGVQDYKSLLITLFDNSIGFLL